MIRGGNDKLLKEEIADALCPHLIKTYLLRMDGWWGWCPGACKLLVVVDGQKEIPVLQLPHATTTRVLLGTRSDEWPVPKLNRISQTQGECVCGGCVNSSNQDQVVTKRRLVCAPGQTRRSPQCRIWCMM